MAKNRAQTNVEPNLSVEKSDQTELASYSKWTPNMPDWLKKIEYLIDCGDADQAKKLLIEEEIQKKLANIDSNDTKNSFFVRCEVAMLLDNTNQVERALRYYSDTLKIVNCAGVYNKMGLLYANCGQCTQAIEHFHKAQQLEPDGIYIWTNLARCFMKTGRPREALSLLRKAISVNPLYREGYPNFIYSLNYLSDVQSSEIFEESKKWAQIQAPANLAFTDHNNSLDPHRKLRIGYISPDFRKHSVTYYFESLLNGHDRNKFELCGYGDVQGPDTVTERLAGKFDIYRNIKGVGDKDAAELIRSDSIDILVDLAGHTGRNRLPVLAYKPAPIQVSYLGYPNTTGMPQVDYKLTDAIADPADQQQYYTEKLVFLPNGFLCYDPGRAQLPVKPLPMRYNKYVTFGCFNNVSKVNPAMVKVWADILNVVPGSKLILKFHEGTDQQVQEYYRNLFAEYGLENPGERITFFGWLTNSEHLELYNNVDIALDTYPYNGTTTTCEAVLMGVPVITLIGSRHASRVSLDILTRLDMPSFAARSPEEYVKKAVALAVEPDALTQIRATMRQRLAASPLCDYKLITSDIEDAYHKMWQDYCYSKGIEISETRSPEDVNYKPRRYSDHTVIDLSVCSVELSQANKNKDILGLDNWEWPDWLKEAERHVSQGEHEEAAELLAEELFDAHIATTSKAEKEFVRYIAAGLLSRMKQHKRAEMLYKEILKSLPNNIAIYNELASLCRNLGRVNEAVQYLETAIKIKPDEPKIKGNLGVYLLQLGESEKAMALLQETVREMPENNFAYSNLFLCMHYVPGVGRKDIFEESRRWAESNAPLHLAKTQHNNIPDPDRRLRIGYVSPDFRQHSVSYFFEPLLDGHNREFVEVYGYGSVANPDKTTARLREKFDRYRDVTKLTDKEVAELVEHDKIDILVDLAGHTGNSRIFVLAYKPAPVQVTWLGYPDTTGMSQVDYRITDSIADPPGSEEFYTEKLYNLPDGFLCYGPGETMPSVTPLAAIQKGHITFGAFNESFKINSVVIDLWSRILKATPDSRLLLKFKAGRDDDFRQECLRQFEEAGISEERISILGWVSLADHLKLYNQVDISLDTYPYNGTTTTCQSLLMGTPVISLVGEAHMSRVGLSILTRLGLEFFAASTPDEYVSKATALAANPDALAKIRAQVRARMAFSPLCNRELFTKNIEQAYRKMWHDYCRSKGVEIKQITSRQDTDYKPRRDSGRTILDNIISADNFYQAGERVKAAKYALKAFGELSLDNNGENPPKQLLERYNADGLQSLVINFCIEIVSLVGSYFAHDSYRHIYSKARKIDPSNPDIDLRIGLLMALQARLKNVKTQDESIKFLEIADSKLDNERSKVALALAKGDLKELSLPYDLARIHLYPDLENITTYVLLEQGDWFEKSDLNLFRSIIRPDDTIFDLGANVGPYSISAAARTDGKVIAVEPALQTFELLNKSASQFSNMTAIHAAISDKPGMAFLSHDGPSENFKLSDNNETPGEKVPLVTVDDIAAEYGIESVDIIKMDVEGHELKALAGAKKIISNGSPIIFYEVKHLNDLHLELVDAFEELGYDSYFALPDAKTIVKYNKEIPVDEYLLNMIAIRPESLQRLEGLVNIEQLQVDVLKSR